MSSRADVASAGTRGLRRSEWVRFALVSFAVWPSVCAVAAALIVLVSGRVIDAVFGASFVTPGFGAVTGAVTGAIFAFLAVNARRARLADPSDPDAPVVVTYRRVQDLPPPRRFGGAA